MCVNRPGEHKLIKYKNDIIHVIIEGGMGRIEVQWSKWSI